MNRAAVINWCPCGRETVVAKGLGLKCYQAAYKRRPEVKAKRAERRKQQQLAGLEARVAALRAELGVG